jgi:hypothetical protein
MGGQSYEPVTPRSDTVRFPKSEETLVLRDPFVSNLVMGVEITERHSE